MNSQLRPQWPAIERIFDEALAHEENERAAFVAAACAGNELLRHEIEALLVADQAAQEARHFLASPLDLIQELPAKLGAYQLQHEIARGGMGTVWLAHRADEQFEQQVAIKLLHAGAASEEVQRRFQHERQILADLNHPNIARLLDGGATAAGQPYFVMEYIAGLPIDEYCQQQQLSVRERLLLFRQVCAAVQYAHQHLIIHRDLKPGNILVTPDGVPKLLDFGVAKLLQPDLTASHNTQSGVTPMTPAYASPEQIRGEKLTTATDVYSLGVVLYELLTGRSPYRLATNTFGELSQAICEQEPTRPSAITATRGRGGTTTWGEEKQSVTVSLPHRVAASQLRGDLDSIVLMALRKEPQARYSSVEQFSADIQRHLEGQPTLARKGNFGYRTLKYLRRHRVPIAAMAAIILTLLTATLLTTRQARIANRRFNDLRKLSNAYLFEFHDAIESLPGTTEARQLVIKRGMEYLDSLAKDAGADTSLQRELAAGYQKLGDVQGRLFAAHLGQSDSALDSYRKAQALLENLLATSSDRQVQRDLGQLYTTVGRLMVEVGQTAGATETFQKGMRLRAALAAADPGNYEAQAQVANDYIEMANLKANTGKDEHSMLEDYRQAVQRWQTIAAAQPENAKYQVSLAKSYWTYGWELAVQGQPDKALTNYQAARAICEALTQKDKTNREARRMASVVLLYTGDAQNASGRPTEALAHYRDALQISERLLAQDTADMRARRDVTLAYERISEALDNQGHLAEAIKMYRKLIAMDEALVATDPTSTRYRRDLVGSYRELAQKLRRHGDLAGARLYSNKAVEMGEAVYATDPQNVMIQGNLAEALILQGQLSAQAGQREDARKQTERGLSIFRTQIEQRGFVGSGYILALLTCEPPDLRAPQMALVQAQQWVEKTNGKAPEELKNLALAYYANGNYEQAVETAKKALALLPAYASGQCQSNLCRELKEQLLRAAALLRKKGTSHPQFGPQQGTIPAH